jgi:tetratricopeptide (TPR) repeat protein
LSRGLVELSRTGIVAIAGGLEGCDFSSFARAAMKYPVILRCCLLMALGLVVGSPVEAAALDNRTIVDQRCRQVKPAAEKIRRCLELIDSNVLEEVWKPAPYEEIAYAYFQIKDVDQAIEYAQRYLSSIRRYHQQRDHVANCKRLQGVMLQFCVKAPAAAISYAQKIVGDYETLKALKSPKDVAVAFARRAIENFTVAISLDPDSHQAYASRAWILRRFCEEDEAHADYAIAIAVALRRGSEQDAVKYRREMGSYMGCEEMYRGSIR